MSPLPIVMWPDKRLRTECGLVYAFDQELRDLADVMLATMYAARGRGLAAPQVGVLKRLFVMDDGWKSGNPEPLVCVNPTVAQISTDKKSGVEQCLSIPNYPVTVKRYTEVQLRWSDLDGNVHHRALSGSAAVIAQHEADHLDGKLILEQMDHAV